MDLGFAKKLIGATVVALVAMATPAQAAVAIFYQVAVVNGNSTAVLGGGSRVNVGGDLGQFEYGITANATQNAASGTLNTTTFTLRNEGDGTGPDNTRTILIYISALNYDLPATTTLLSSSASGTSSSALAGQTAVLQSYADDQNRRFDSGGLNSVTTGAQNGSATGAAPPTVDYAFTPTNTSTTFVSTAQYSLSQVIRVTLRRGMLANLTLTTAVSPAAVPEPATLALAFSGLPVMGLFWARRRRKA